MSKSRSEIANKMRLLKLPPVIKDSVRDGIISYGHARTLIAIRKSKDMILIYHKTINHNLSVREAELLAKRTITKDISSQIDKKNKFLKFTKTLSTIWGTTIKIKINKTERGIIQINFTSLKHLKKLIKKLSYEE